MNRVFIIALILLISLSSFTGIERSMNTHLIGYWKTQTVKDERFKNLTFHFSDGKMEIIGATGVIATGTLHQFKEEVAIASDPFIYEQQEKMALIINSTVSGVSLPKVISVRSLSKDKMQVSFLDGKFNRYLTLKKKTTL
ncbi:hypothetical protein [Pseudochryseolinea flava]|nr:hypothetical protein [Pseudochryseolinea flava]